MEMASRSLSAFPRTSFDTTKAQISSLNGKLNIAPTEDRRAACYRTFPFRQHTYIVVPRCNDERLLPFLFIENEIDRSVLDLRPLGIRCNGNHVEILSRLLILRIDHPWIPERS